MGGWEGVTGGCNCCSNIGCPFWLSSAAYVGYIQRSRAGVVLGLPFANCMALLS